MTVAEDTFLLGSGDLYIGVVSPTATEEEINAALENVGAISGGAALTYSPSFYEVKSGNRGTIASFKTEETVTFKSGILTWDLKNIEKLSAAYYSEGTGTRRVGVGGMKNIPVNYLRFVHTKPDGLKLTVNVFKAQAQSGFELTFDKEKETVIDAEFKALAVTGKYDGNLVEIIEEVGTQPSPTVSTISPTTMTTASLPLMVKVTGTNFNESSVVFAEQFDGEHELNTFYSSPTVLYAEVKGLTAATYQIKAKNGSQVTTVGQNLTIS
ncbi:IPT/TIG domain-containing protein [Neobacillus sp. 3P2-tot-E-2]|uniref:IPT/TIG domain-containing protein n=1 Tax=Neobacillus sp. 3P2-tot-E-2 TaxID=3132212 RepID=UPI0039A3D791